jgi:hypothetical protein
MKQTTINKKSIIYDDLLTVFKIELGNLAGAYKPIKKITGRLNEAFFIYNSLKLESGMKKRLISYDLSEFELIKEFKK